MNVQITLTSFSSTAVVSSGQSAAIQIVKNADGTTTHTHSCNIAPKSGINDCSYMVYIPNAASGVSWNWKLISWTYA